MSEVIKETPILYPELRRSLISQTIQLVAFVSGPLRLPV